MRLFTFLRGTAIGAGLMYFLDPIHGRTRQSHFRDRMVGYRNDVEDIVQAGVKDLSNKARGLAAETRARVNQKMPDDWVLEERVRSRLGSIPGRTGGITVSAQNGTVYLDGDVMRDEVDNIISRLTSSRGLGNIENRLRVHDDPGDIPALQNASDSRGRMMWSPSTRLLAGVGSLYLLMRGRRGGLLSPLFTLGGLVIGAQVMTNKNVRQLVGMEEGSQGAIHVVKTIHVQAPVEEVYRMWRSFPNFSRFMSHVHENQEMDGGKSHWVVDGPAGVPVKFDTIMTQDIPNEVIAWETLPDSTVKHSGQVRFRELGSGTQVNVRMHYTPPAGVIGHAVAAFFGSDPKSAMDTDLVRFKSLMEEGETRSEGQTVRQEDVIRD
jgi:uncharacterized membrane protein